MTPTEIEAEFKDRLAVLKQEHSDKLWFIEGRLTYMEAVVKLQVSVLARLIDVAKEQEK